MEPPLFLLGPQHGKDLQGPIHGLEGHLQCLGKLRQDADLSGFPTGKLERVQNCARVMS